MRLELYGNERVLIKVALLAFLADLRDSGEFVDLMSDDVMLPLIKDALETAEAKTMVDYWDNNPKDLFHLAVNTVKKLP